MRAAAADLQKHFSVDLQVIYEDEIVHFAACVEQVLADNCTPFSALRHIRKVGITETFPNVDISLRLYLTLPVANTEGERSFSFLKRVKNHLRSKLSQDKLCNLALLTIESDLTKDINFQDTIDAFAKFKSRRKAI